MDRDAAAEAERVAGIQPVPRGDDVGDPPAVVDQGGHPGPGREPARYADPSGSRGGDDVLGIGEDLANSAEQFRADQRHVPGRGALASGGGGGHAFLSPEEARHHFAIQLEMADGRYAMPDDALSPRVRAAYLVEGEGVVDPEAFARGLGAAPAAGR
ncbi:hypothetical protein QQY66_05325 [Streptomyces sp. DG2A-72]|uniref:hypothetical protein n=1 Tax=Streptomyces sp. DG2A-72 TaxID=3051386 RepID=UPI00265C21D6|nr:hypothetical protein [Streptomyces sp. DG2A-72]MDO0931129.1 hypothetical protein [Streptomyces sp. DG2A-72]